MCGLKGHFSVCCGKRGSSKPNANNNAKGKKAYHVSGETSYGSGDGYAFVVGQQCQDGEVTLTIGGVKLKGVLIDSGASCNLIDYETWDNLKRNSVKCDSKQSDKKLFAYGQKEPIQVAGFKLLEHLSLKLFVRLTVRNVWMSSQCSKVLEDHCLEGTLQRN